MYLNRNIIAGLFIIVASAAPALAGQTLVSTIDGGYNIDTYDTPELKISNTDGLRLHRRADGAHRLSVRHGQLWSDPDGCAGHDREPAAVDKRYLGHRRPVVQL